MPWSIDVRPATNNLTVGAERQLTVTFEPENYDGPITWSTTDPNIATVNDYGVVTAVAPGSAQIYAYTVRETVYIQVTINVTE